MISKSSLQNEVQFKTFCFFITFFIVQFSLFFLFSGLSETGIRLSDYEFSELVSVIDTKYDWCSTRWLV